MSGISINRGATMAMVVAAVAAMSNASAGAQMVGGHEGRETAATATSSHMRLTPARSATPEDSARAAAVVSELVPAIAKYRDVRLAEKDGFKLFAPGVKGQRVYHYTNYRNTFREQFRFDPTRPTSLLYEDAPNGERVLVGAMYVAPKRASLEELDERIPLGIAQWHAHIDICLPKRGERERWLERRDGQSVYGPAGVIATKAECDKVGGRFHEQLFGWMVHVTLPTAADPRARWGHDTGTASQDSGGHQH